MTFCQFESILQAMMVIRIFQFLPQFLIPEYQIVIKRVTKWISIEISSKNIKPYDTNLEPLISNLANASDNGYARNVVIFGVDNS